MIYKAGLHKNKAAFENKIPMLFADPIYSDEAIETASKMNEYQQEYKGLEYVLKAYTRKAERSRYHAGYDIHKIRR